MATKYILMKLNTHLIMLGKEVKVQGCAGVLPVFDSQAQAEQNNPESKFQIIPIEIKQ